MGMVEGTELGSVEEGGWSEVGFSKRLAFTGASIFNFKD